VVVVATDQVVLVVAELVAVLVALQTRVQVVELILMVERVVVADQV
jgi:hypothetical protein